MSKRWTEIIENEPFTLPPLYELVELKFRDYCYRKFMLRGMRQDNSNDLRGWSWFFNGKQIRGNDEPIAWRPIPTKHPERRESALFLRATAWLGRTAHVVLFALVLRETGYNLSVLWWMVPIWALMVFGIFADREIAYRRALTKTTPGRRTR